MYKKDSSDFLNIRPLVDDLVFVLSRFLFFLKIRQDSFVVPSIQDSCLKKQILSFWQDSCRQNLGWWGKKCLARQDSCVLVFLSDSYVLAILAWFLFSCFSGMILVSCHFSKILAFLQFLPFWQNPCNTNEFHLGIHTVASFRSYYIFISN